MKEVLYITDRGCNVAYLTEVLSILNQKGTISVTHFDLYQYSRMPDTIQNDYDVLIYQTFPHENHPTKWNAAQIAETDKLFESFKGPKILFDAHDSSSVNAFSRFGNQYPRIKAHPTKQYCEEFDVILTTAFTFRKDKYRNKIIPQDTNRTYDVSYCVSYGYDPIYAQGISKTFAETKLREQIRDILKTTNHNVDMGWHDDYQSYIKSVLISVCAPGWCEGSLRHLETLNVGALMLAHDCIDDCQLVPNVHLVEGEDYVSFNLDNLSEKLDYLMNNREEVDRIRFNGQRKFIESYDFNLSAETLAKYIETL